MPIGDGRGPIMMVEGVYCTGDDEKLCTCT